MYRALICVTTCQRPGYLRRYLPHLARFCAEDPRFHLLVSLDGEEEDTSRFCEEWEVPLIHSREREGVGISKNRALEAFPDFDYYFFVEDDVELIDGSVFPAHVEMSRASGIHHFSLFSQRRIRDYSRQTTVAGHSVVHVSLGSAHLNFFTREGLQQVGGWHPRFAQYRRWGHTEHSYRFVTAGLAPAPFNVASDLTETCIWHIPPSVTRPNMLPADGDQLVAPERELIDEALTHVPVQTIAPYRFNGAPFEGVGRLGSTLEAGGRYPLVRGEERRHCRADYQLWRFRSTASARSRTGALIASALQWPTNPMLRHTVRTALEA